MGCSFFICVLQRKPKKVRFSLFQRERKKKRKERERINECGKSSSSSDVNFSRRNTSEGGWLTQIPNPPLRFPSSYRRRKGRILKGGENFSGMVGGLGDFYSRRRSRNTAFFWKHLIVCFPDPPPPKRHTWVECIGLGTNLKTLTQYKIVLLITHVMHCVIPGFRLKTTWVFLGKICLSATTSQPRAQVPRQRGHFIGVSLYPGKGGTSVSPISHKKRGGGRSDGNSKPPPTRIKKWPLLSSRWSPPPLYLGIPG